MKIYLVTKNKHKVEEIVPILTEYNVEVEQIRDEKYEPKEMTLTAVAEFNAKLFYEKYKKPIVIDDTGVFFKAYPGFPGSNAKLIYTLLGYKGLLKLLENETRDAEFMTVVGYFDGKNLKTFTGLLRCVADTKVNDPDRDVLPYERILLYDNKPLSRLPREVKNSISHRSEAFRKLGIFLSKQRSE